ncbi:uncharacterized protein [Apostichopus japonicus]|uniref:uncharacterized protein isoform X2 n=1 Tax=Stichopus japonicus TaxID=307972 RepID=UPI003AB718B4
MGAIQVEVKILSGAKPILFSWENPLKKSVECVLVTCACQALGLRHGKAKGKDRTALTSGSQQWASNLAHALEKAEVVTYASMDPLESIANHIDLNETEGVDREYSKEEWKLLTKYERQKIRRKRNRQKQKESLERQKEQLVVCNQDEPSAATLIDEVSTSPCGQDDSEVMEAATTVDEEMCEPVVPKDKQIGEGLLDVTSNGEMYPTGKDFVVDPDSSEEVTEVNTSREVEVGRTECDVPNEILPETQVITTHDQPQDDLLNESLKQNQIWNDGHSESITTASVIPTANSAYLETTHEPEISNEVTLEATVSAETSNPVTIISVDEAVASHKGSKVTTGSSDNNTVQFVDIQGAVVVSSAFPSSVSSSLSDEQTLMKAIDSIMDMCPAPEMGESPVLPETMYTLPTTTTTPNELPRTKVPFIRNLTEEERKKMFKFQSDSERENQAALESGNACLCEQCGKIFGQRNLSKHMQIHKKGRERNLICDKCGKGFYLKSALKNHLQVHNDKAQFTCRYCPKSYKSFFGRTIHERLHFAVYPEECQNCERKFKSNRELKIHLASGHCDNNVKGKRKPKMCGYTRKSSVPMKHGQFGSTTCHICNKVLRTGSFRAHMLVHQGKMYTCSICNKVMAFSTRYYHLRMHKNKKDFKCNVCTKEFLTKQALVAHLRVHTGERPIKCRHCDRMFSRYSSREVHEASHTGERAFKCTICDKSWKDRSSYWLHMKKNHPGEPLYYRRLSAQINSERKTQGIELQPSIAE